MSGAMSKHLPIRATLAQLLASGDPVSQPRPPRLSPRRWWAVP